MSAKKNYNKISMENKVENITEAEPEVIEEVIEEIILASGRVVDCIKLNVRKEAKSDSEVLGTIDLNAIVEINETESTKDFYKVITEDGLEGFCMAKYIKIN